MSNEVERSQARDVIYEDRIVDDLGIFDIKVLVAGGEVYIHIDQYKAEGFSVAVGITTTRKLPSKVVRQLSRGLDKAMAEAIRQQNSSEDRRNDT